jgi:hypothetical protein
MTMTAMRPRRRQKPVAIGNVPISVVLLQVSGAYAIWCYANHEVAWSMTPDGVRRQALRIHGAEIAAALAAAGWEPRIVTLTVGEMRAVLDTTWKPVRIVTGDHRIPAALAGSASRDAAAALHAAGEPLEPGQPAGPERTDP